MTSQWRHPLGLATPRLVPEWDSKPRIAGKPSCSPAESVTGLQVLPLLGSTGQQQRETVSSVCPGEQIIKIFQKIWWMKFPVLFLYPHRTSPSDINQSRSIICKEVTLIYTKTKAAQNALGTTEEKPSLGIKATQELHPLPPPSHHQLLYTLVCTCMVPFSII